MSLTLGGWKEEYERENELKTIEEEEEEECTLFRILSLSMILFLGIQHFDMVFYIFHFSNTEKKRIQQQSSFLNCMKYPIENDNNKQQFTIVD